ncbi:MAG: hypothetical protein NC177_00140 [Ruminococcus flavefaciens]|nr:hypothetical protein [Ruminococcus flavefaciens]
MISAVISAVLPVIYVILSFINIYNTDISTAIFHETYDFWKDSTWFTPLIPVEIEDYIFSIIFIIPYVIVCLVSIFPEKLKGKNKLTYSTISFLIFIFINYIQMNEISQSTTSDNWVQIGLVSRLQNIFMLLNIISFMIMCCTAFIEIRTAKKFDRRLSQ